MNPRILLFFGLLTLVFTSSAQTPLSGCQIISASGQYALSANLSDANLSGPGGGANVSCLIINTSNVEIDCNGFSMVNGLAYNASRITAAVSSSGAPLNNLTVKNCNILGYQRSLFLENFSNATLSNISSLGGSTYSGSEPFYIGAEIRNSPSLQVRNCVFTNVTYGLNIYRSGQSNISDNNFDRNIYALIAEQMNNSVFARNNGTANWYMTSVNSSHNNLFTGNIMLSCYNGGIYISYSNNNVISNNVHVSGRGYVIRGSNNLITNNTASQSGNEGFYIQNSGTTVSRNNTLINNTLTTCRVGFYVQSADSTYFINNTAYGNQSAFGVSETFGFRSYLATNTSFIGNTARDWRNDASGAYGFKADYFSNHTLFENNTAINNTWGFDVNSGDNTTMRGNLAANSTGLGFASSDRYGSLPTNVLFVDNIALSSANGFQIAAINGIAINNTVISCPYGINVFNGNSNIVNNTVRSSSFFGIRVAGTNANNTFAGNNISNSGMYGFYYQTQANHTLNIYSNTVCYSTLMDFNTTNNWSTSYGYNNTCSRPDGWNDTGISGCTYICPESNAPTVFVLLPPHNAWFSNATVNISWRATDDTTDNMNCSLYINGINAANATVANNTNHSVLVGPLSEGQKTWNVTCTDRFNNIGVSATRIFTVDTDNGAEPIVTLISPPNGTTFTGNGFTSLNWTAVDDLSANILCSVYLDGVNVQNVYVLNNTESASYPDPGRATHIWNVECFDLAGNNGTSENWTFTIRSGGGNDPFCGDGVCNTNEDCASCASDCGECAPECGDGTCNGNENCSTCSADCGNCPPLPQCGDGRCNGAETCSNCASDCGECTASCGDGSCNGAETCSSCSSDCGSCQPAQQETCQPDDYCNFRCFADPDCCHSNAECPSGQVCANGRCEPESKTGCSFNNPKCGDCFACVNNACVEMYGWVYFSAPLEVPINTEVEAKLLKEDNTPVSGTPVSIADPFANINRYVTDSQGKIFYTPDKEGYYTYSLECFKFNISRTLVTSAYDPDSEPTTKTIVIPLYVPGPSELTMEVISLGRGVQADVRIKDPSQRESSVSTTAEGRYQQTLNLPGKYIFTVSAKNVRSLAARIDLTPVAAISTGSIFDLLPLLALLLALILLAYLFRNKLLPMASKK